MNTKCWDNIQPIKPQLFSEASLCQCLNASLPVLCSDFWCNWGSFLLWRSWNEPLVLLVPTGSDPASCLFSPCVKGAGSAQHLAG